MKTYKSIKFWKPKSTPNIIVSKYQLATFDTHLFNCFPPWRTVPPFWTINTPKTSRFPGNKKSIANNPTMARLFFRAVLTRSPNTITIFTDGSVDPTDGSAACAVYCPSLNIRSSWNLAPFSSILTAELIAIFKATEFCMNLNAGHIRIFSDSLTAVNCIGSRDTHNSNYWVSQIQSNAVSALSGGTQIEFSWIPSHIGIPENEIADRLANECRNLPSSAPHPNCLTSSEIISSFKPRWFRRTCAYINNLHSSTIESPRPSLNPPSWLIHKNRRISSLLHRLRANRTHLNARRAAFDPSIAPYCPFCPTAETRDHVLLFCPEYRPFRREMIVFFTRHNITLSLPNILGLNSALPSSVNLRIRALLLKFITDSGLIAKI